MQREDVNNSGTFVLDRDPNVKDRNEEKIQEPSMYKVLLHNDDYTPFELVVEVLVDVFKMTGQKAFAIMLECHVNGVGLCGIFPKDVAETKVEEAHAMAKAHDFALNFTCEKND